MLEIGEYMLTEQRQMLQYGRHLPFVANSRNRGTVTDCQGESLRSVMSKHE
jgi:hypothetical protein